MRQTVTASALSLQAWAGEPDNVKKAQDILYQLAVANGQAQVRLCRPFAKQNPCGPLGGGYDTEQGHHALAAFAS